MTSAAFRFDARKRLFALPLVRVWARFLKPGAEGLPECGRIPHVGGGSRPQACGILPSTRFAGTRGKHAITWAKPSRRSLRSLARAPLVLSVRTAVPIVAVIAMAGCQGSHSAPSRAVSAAIPASVRFVDVAAQAGIHFKHTNGRSGRFYFPETMGSGCAFLDYDGDGHLDLFLVNSSRLPGFRGSGPFYPALYRNRGDGTFGDVTRQAGLAIDCYGMGCAVGDYDNDGRPDLYLTALGPNHLFHNEGSGTGGGPVRFVDVTERAGVGDPRFSTSCAWFDYDRDGRLDLFVCNYCQWSPQQNVLCPELADRLMCPPTRYQGITSTLYRNLGGGRFADVTRSAGLANPAGKALGVALFDLDDDGFLDLCLANDLEPNALYRNRHHGTFQEIGVEAGVAYGMRGRARAGMGIDTADLVGEGREDVLIGNFSGERVALFRDGGGGQFVDAAEEAGLGEASYPYTTFGAVFVDYDLDGRKDICLANGHADESVGRAGSGVRFAQRLLLFHNEGEARFAEVDGGPGFQGRLVGRGLAVGDYDEDGDPDLLVTENSGPARLLRNDGGNGNREHWVAFRLIGERSPRDGNGARLRIRAGGVSQTGWVRSGGSYCSASEGVCRFGLGGATKVDDVEVRWSSGREEKLSGVGVDRVVTVREGHGIVQRD
jgi:enediyne biosynthesis protein E4